MDKIFKTCTAIYNQKLVSTGGDEPWASMHEIPNEDVDADGVDLFSRLSDIITSGDINAEDMCGMGTGDSVMDSQPAPLSERLLHDNIKKKLIIHFEESYKRKEVVWPRRDQVS